MAGDIDFRTFSRYQIQFSMQQMQEKMGTLDAQERRNIGKLDYPDLSQRADQFVLNSHSLRQATHMQEEAKCNQMWLSNFQGTLERFLDLMHQVRENFTSVTTVDAQHLHMYGEQNAGFFEQCFAMANSHFNLQYMFGGMGTQRPPFSENLLADFKERYGFEAFEPYDGPGPYPDYDPADPQLNRVGTPFHVENYVQNSPDARVFSMGDHESYTVPLKARDLTKLFQSMIIFAEAVRKGEVTAEVIQECGVMIDHLIPQVQDAVGYAAVALQTSERVIEESLEKREAAIEAHDQLVGFNTLKHAQEKSELLMRIKAVLRTIEVSAHLLNSFIDTANAVSRL